MLAHGGQEHAKLLVERRALGVPPGPELSQRLVERVVEQRPPLFGRQRRLLLARDDARLLEQPLKRRGSAEVQLVAGPADKGRVCAGLGHVDREVGRGRAFERRHAHADFDPAALDRALDQAPRIELERRERARETEGDVEVAMVEGLALHGQTQSDPGHFGTAIAGHAADHRGLDQ